MISSPRRASASIDWRIDERTLTVLALCLLAVNVGLRFPGEMTYDSDYQYEEARSGAYTDWHPPIMAWAWSLFASFLPGPLPMLVLHLGMYWLGFLSLSQGLFRSGRRGGAIAALMIGAFPPFMYYNGFIIKDAGMVSAWVAASGLLLKAALSGRRPSGATWVAIGALFSYGLLVRANSVFAAGAIVLLAAIVAFDRPVRRDAISILVASVLVALVAIPATRAINQYVFDPKPMNAVHSLFLFDLAGIAAHERDPSLMAPRATLDAAKLERCYTPYWWDSFSPWGACASTVERPGGNRGGPPDGLAWQWLDTIVAHPLAYATHRLKHFNSSIYFVVPAKHNRFAPEFRGDDPAFPSIEPVTETSIRVDYVKKNPLVWPVNWLVIALTVIAVLWRAAPEPSVVAARLLLVSAVMYSGAYLVVGVATDMRYHFWTLMACAIALVLAWPALGRAWAERRRSLQAGLAVLACIVVVGMAARILDISVWVV